MNAKPLRMPAEPLRVMFLVTSLPVGGAETLLMNLVRKLDRRLVHPEIVCLKERGPLGDLLASEIPLHENLLRHKFDLRVLWRLWRLMRQRQIDAIVTVGAGDKMFWGRLAAKLAGVRIVVSALHSTGWPDSVGRLNRWLTPITDAFIGVAANHSRHLIDRECFPAHKVVTIPNGVDTSRFAPGESDKLRRELGLDANTKLVGILAALRPEKNHALFLRGAARVLPTQPDTRFIVIGDGPCRGELEQLAGELGIRAAVHFLGSRDDVPELLPALDVITLTSHNEASPMSLMEALSCGVPAVAADVGSVHETVRDHETGRLFPAGDEVAFVNALTELLANDPLRRRMGIAGRARIVTTASVEVMVRGYEQLLLTLYARKSHPQRQVSGNDRLNLLGRETSQAPSTN